jgi:predicted nucleic acid-binding protein
MLPRRDHPFAKQSTDQLLLDFANEFPTVIEFSNLATSQVINLRYRELFTSTTEQLDKKERKTILARFDYLLSEGITSIPLSRGAISTGLELLSRFVAQFRPKQDLRNTINDIFILATALDARAELVTKDSTLARFAGEVFGVRLQSRKDHIIMDFSRSLEAAKKRSKESKGYVNRGWQFHFRNYGSSQTVA